MSNFHNNVIQILLVSDSVSQVSGFCLWVYLTLAESHSSWSDKSIITLWERWTHLSTWHSSNLFSEFDNYQGTVLTIYASTYLTCSSTMSECGVDLDVMVNKTLEKTEICCAVVCCLIQPYFDWSSNSQNARGIQLRNLYGCFMGVISLINSAQATMVDKSEHCCTLSFGKTQYANN